MCSPVYLLHIIRTLHWIQNEFPHGLFHYNLIVSRLFTAIHELSSQHLPVRWDGIFPQLSSSGNETQRLRPKLSEVSTNFVCPRAWFLRVLSHFTALYVFKHSSSQLQLQLCAFSTSASLIPGVLKTRHPENERTTSGQLGTLLFQWLVKSHIKHCGNGRDRIHFSRAAFNLQNHKTIISFPAIPSWFIINLISATNRGSTDNCLLHYTTLIHSLSIVILCTKWGRGPIEKIVSDHIIKECLIVHALQHRCT